MEYTYRDSDGKERLVVARGTKVFGDEIHRIYVMQVRAKPQKFDVLYGLQRRDNLDYAETFKELGACLMHAASCDGLVRGE
jgi:hypothetical protein